MPLLTPKTPTERLKERLSNTRLGSEVERIAGTEAGRLLAIGLLLKLFASRRRQNIPADDESDLDDL